MAFVRLEDKVGEIEVTVFPRTFEEVGAKLIVDTVVKVSGKVNARDRDGVLTDEAKINAEEITVITDEELENYESTGATLKTPTKGVAQKQPRGKTAATSVGGGGGGYRRSSDKPTTQFKTSESEINAQPLKPKKLFVRVEDSSNTKALMDLKKICGTYPGLSEVILVIGPEKKAMRMPFRVELEDVLVSGLKEIFGDEGVVAK
jgi:DNA polymerase III alpha subunit